MTILREIGGYLELDEFIDNEFYSDLVALNTGRNALLYLTKARNIEKLYIPSFLCSSIGEVLNNNDFKFEYYNINLDFKPDFNNRLNKNEYILIVNYYGQLDTNEILKLKRQYKNIIIDNTQAFFQKPVKDTDTIYSCRKFFGVPDGAYLATEHILNENLKIDVSKDRMSHILGRFEGQASDYYSQHQQNDYSFKEEPLKKMSRLTRNILRAINYDKVIEVRNENFKFLNKHLNSLNNLKLKVPHAPFAYPLFIENAIEAKRKLIEKKIYIPTLWPNVLEETDESSVEYQYASKILPLPCDQRYGLDEMQYMVDLIKREVT